MVGGLRGTFPDDDSTADLAEAVEDAVPRQLARGFTSFCFKPNQFIDDAAIGASSVARPRPRRRGRGAITVGSRRHARHGRRPGAGAR